ncbi:MAG: hypothetical protein V4486_03500 [Patescibacteria group bacterium]
MDKQKISILLIVILLAGNVFFGYKYFSNAKVLADTQAKLQTQTTNGAVLDFTKLFIKNVLMANSEVDFDTRLKLENAVRNLGDAEILTKWTEFVDSKTADAAQQAVKNLLEVLVNKIKIQ